MEQFDFSKLKHVDLKDFFNKNDSKGYSLQHETSRYMSVNPVYSQGFSNPLKKNSSYSGGFYSFGFSNPINNPRNFSPQIAIDYRQLVGFPGSSCSNCAGVKYNTAEGYDSKKVDYTGQ